MSNKIWLSSPHMGEQELRYVLDAFATNWIAPLGPNVNRFEQTLQNFLGNNSCVAALSSGTAALHLALIVLGVRPGDEVLCQSMTFVASANPITYLGATPVFVDSETASWNVCPDLLETAILDRLRRGHKPKAAIIVHLYGMPAQLDKISELSRKYEIPIVEDAAEALGSSFKGQYLATFGELGVLSFNGNKIITTSGGGALVSLNEKYIAKARFLATQALDAAPHYQHSEIGYNYRMSNVCAGIGIGQMQVLQERVRQRRQNFEFYREALSPIEEICLPDEPNGDCYSNRWLTTILLRPSRITPENLRSALVADNIDCRPLWKPLHLQPVYADAPFYGNGVSEKLFQSGLCLPSGSNLTPDDLQRVTDSIRHCFRA